MGVRVPGTTELARNLFNYFSNLAFEKIRQLISEGKPEEHRREARLYTRAALDVLRSNFACSSVPSWGSFRDYIDMCSLCLDNIKNLALILDDTWTPGELKSGDPDQEKHRGASDLGTATAEEIMFLYNEIGLA